LSYTFDDEQSHLNFRATILIFLYGLGAVHGLIISLFLFLGAKQLGANRVMALWCLFLSLSFLGGFIYLDKTINVFSFLIGWTYFLPAAYGGLLYLYCKKLLDRSEFALEDTVHLLPLVLCYALNIDILLAPSEQKLSYILTLPPLTPSFYISQAILYLQAIVYFALSIRLLLTYKKSYKEQFSDTTKDKSNWLAILICLSLVIWLIKMSASFFVDISWLSNLGSALIVVLIYLIGFMQWLKPQLFVTQGLMHIPKPLVLSKHLSDLHADAAAQTREERLALDAETHALFAKVLVDTVKNEHLYLQESLSLAQVSAQTDISIHHISETLNHHLEKNFYRFINEFRIEHFCTELASNHQSKILDLALRSGFSNKSTFNAAFKEFKGLTPSEYRLQLDKE
tara:strand:+ start:1061 stop:2254 length:1194 start_codon:yes stop_codon:yes gene_type:complete